MFRSFVQLAPRFLLSCLLSLPLSEAQQPPPPTAAPSDSAGGQKRVRLKRPRIDPIAPFYDSWLREDAIWIISDEERSAFKQLSNDEERDNFIEAFWMRRNPVPNAEENECKEGHYGRIEYANERFGAGIPGWKTDRGRIYILFGPPGKIETYPGRKKPDASPDAPASPEYPREVWRYHHRESAGEDVALEFVDVCGCGDFRLTLDRVGQASGEYLSEQLGRWCAPAPVPVGLVSAPPVRFPELALALAPGTIILLNPLPFDVRTDFVRVTGITTAVPITLQLKNQDLKFANEQGVDRAAVKIFGRIRTLTDHVVETFEETLNVDVPHELLPRALGNSSVYTHQSVLPHGSYRLTIAVEDVNGARVGIWGRTLVVPQFSDGLAASSMILAKTMSPQIAPPCPSRVGGLYEVMGNPSCAFAIGGTRLVPIVPPADGKPVAFHQGQRINVWMQVYNLQVDEKKHAPSASIEYSVVDTATNTTVSHHTGTTDDMLPLADQITLRDTISAADLKPGSYQFQIKVHDNDSGQAITESAAFSVE